MLGAGSGYQIQRVWHHKGDLTSRDRMPLQASQQPALCSPLSLCPSVLCVVPHPEHVAEKSWGRTLPTLMGITVWGSELAGRAWVARGWGHAWDRPGERFP